MPALLQSKLIINLSLLIVVFGLALLVWLIPPQDATNKNIKRVIASDILPENISRLEINTPNKPKTVLEKKADHWYLTAPIHIEANDFLATQVSKLLSIEYSDTFTPESYQLVKYGLSPAWITLQLDQHTVSLGNKNSISQQRYVGYQQAIFLIPDKIPPILNSAPGGLISTKILPNTSQITALQLSDFEVQKRDGKWHMLDSLSSAAEPISQDRFVKFLTEWQLAHAIYVGLEATKLTPQKPSNSIKINLVDGQIISFNILDKESGVQFIRADLGVAYHMHNEAVHTLLNFPQAGH